MIGDNLVRAWKIINDPKYHKIICSISGGSDSDIMLDICWRCDVSNKIDYVWFDTGLEYQATKDHLDYLEKRYNISIIRRRPKKPIPLACKEYGQPFVSKFISDYLSRLQKHGFTWEDRPYDELVKEYPRCQMALKWWTDSWGEGSRFNISFKKYLREFILENPPQFSISSKCCQYAKKDVIHQIIKENKYDLNIMGIRRAEGGQRSVTYKSCFLEKTDKNTDRYMPIFWYGDTQKHAYEDHYEIVHSRCYTEYGLKRTGCVGCPYGRNFEFELEVLKEHEPKLLKAVENIFSDSYEYTRKFNEFREQMRLKEKQEKAK